MEKRNGFVTLSGSSLTGEPVKATNVHTLYPANANVKSLLGVATTATTDTIFKMTAAGTASVLKTGLTANTRWHWAQAEVNGAQGPLFGLNGVDTPQRWNGEAASTSDWTATTGTVPKEAKYLTYFSSRLWCAKGSRLYYSGITGSTPDPTNWDAENFVDLEPNDGQSITGIGVIQSTLIVFKSRKTYEIYDPVNAANRQLSKEIGCVAHRSIVQTPAGLFFLSEDQGVCKTDGRGVAPFSDQIKPILTDVEATPETAARAAGTLLGRRYKLSVSVGGTRNDRTLEYDLITGSWWIHDCATNQYALLDPGGDATLYSADSLASARVSKAFVENVFADNGAAYKGESFYITPHYAWSQNGKAVDPHRVKRIREVRVDGIGSWEAFIATDFAETWTPIEGETWSGGEQAESASGFFEVNNGTVFEGPSGGVFEEEVNEVVDRHYHTPGLGRTASFKYSDNSTNNFKILSQAVAIQARED